MARLLLRSSLVMTAVFVLMIGVIRARPYDGGELRTFFLPENCRQPCWQQIRPGVTTVDEALAILQADTWVSQIERDNRGVNWFWSGRQPALVNADAPGVLLVHNDRVLSVRVQLNAAFGDLQLAFGQPDWTSAGKFRRAVRVQFTYPEDYLTLSLVLECPMSPDSFWRSHPEIALNHMRRVGVEYESNNQFLKRC